MSENSVKDWTWQIALVAVTACASLCVMIVFAPPTNLITLGLVTLIALILAASIVALLIRGRIDATKVYYSGIIGLSTTITMAGISGLAVDASSWPPAVSFGARDATVIRVGVSVLLLIPMSWVRPKAAHEIGRTVALVVLVCLFLGSVFWATRPEHVATQPDRRGELAIARAIGDGYSRAIRGKVEIDADEAYIAWADTSMLEEVSIVQARLDAWSEFNSERLDAIFTSVQNVRDAARSDESGMSRIDSRSKEQLVALKREQNKRLHASRFPPLTTYRHMRRALFHCILYVDADASVARDALDQIDKVAPEVELPGDLIDIVLDEEVFTDLLRLRMKYLEQFIGRADDSTFYVYPSHAQQNQAVWVDAPTQLLATPGASPRWREPLYMQTFFEEELQLIRMRLGFEESQ